MEAFIIKSLGKIEVEKEVDKIYCSATASSNLIIPTIENNLVLITTEADG